MPDNTIPELPADATPEQKDAHWFRHVYQGDRMPQLTVRAVVMGGFLGMLMSAANLYTTLQIGWAFGIAITACVLSFVIWNTVRLAARGKVSQMSILENACMASCASAAGYATGSTIATMFGALVLLEPIPEGKTTADMYTWDITPPWVVVVFTLCTGLMGVFLAIPMKRQMINHERLPFPTGTAAAETLRSLYSESADAIKKAYILVAGLASGLIIGFLRAPDDVVEKVGLLRNTLGKIPFLRIPGELEIHAADRLYPGGRHPAGFAFEPSALLIAAGMIVGMRISASLLIASLLLYVGVGPYLAKQDAAVLERPAMAVLDAVRAADKADAMTTGDFTDPAHPDRSSIVAWLQADAQRLADAAADAAAAFNLDTAVVRKAALNAATGAINDFAAGHDDPPGGYTDEALASIEKGVAKALGGAASTAAALDAADLPGRLAADRAKADALAKGLPDDRAAAAALDAFNQAKFKPNFTWSWAGETLVIHRWSLWGGTAVMVFSSLTAVALQWKTIARAFTGVRAPAATAPGDTPIEAQLAKIEVPGSWMIVGMLPITIAMVWLQVQAFGVTWYAGLIAVAMSFVLSLVASRATGETDTTPIGAMGKVMQLLFAALAPRNLAANLASAGIAANSASSSADLLTDLKTGYLLGANPRRQFLAQFTGVFFGTVAIVPIWYLMVPTRAKLEEFALPATQAWAGVARVLTKGISELPPSAVTALFIGSAVGIALPVLERLLPAKARRFMPSATGLGLAWVMPFQNAFSFFVGAVLALLWFRAHKKSSENYNIPLASGLIAGESLMLAGLAIAATLVGLLA
ncbi:MAG: OPT/YSL family transporter [Phycisphaeraceae bacterium]|nr:MAG: OPT/YSL family transporter [Phycisphaeraceae bacterium]